MSVVVRSAPVSRAGSRGRGSGGRGSGEEDGREGRNRKARKDGERGRGRKRKDDGDRVPSLASTEAEGDVWAKEKERERRSGGVVRRSDVNDRGGNRYLSGWGAEPEDNDEEEQDGKQSLSSEDDGELNLAKILVPPKRQNSIKSLRKHLSSFTAIHPDTGSTAVVGASAGMARASNRAGLAGRSGASRQIRENDWEGPEEEQWGAGWVRKGGSRSRGSEDDEDELVHTRFLGDGGAGRKGSGSERSTTSQRRVGLPEHWSTMGSGS